MKGRQIWQPACDADGQEVVRRLHRLLHIQAAESRWLIILYFCTISMRRGSH